MEATSNSEGNDVRGGTSNVHLKWDGTFIGSHAEDSILRRRECYPYDLWHLSLEFEGVFHRFWAAVQACSNSVPCLIDEISGECGLGKIGTHRAEFTLSVKGRRTRRKVVLYCMEEGEDGYVKLNYYNGPTVPDFNYRIELLLVLRMAMGQRSNGESSMIVVNCEPRSFRHCEGGLKGEPMDIESGILKRYYREQKISDAARTIRNGNGREDFNELLEHIIDRIDPAFCWYRGMAVARLNQLL